MDGDIARRGARPPYAPLKGVREFFERVTAKEPPARVDKQYLQHLGVAAGNEQHLVVALRTLRLIDDEGRPTRAFDVLYLQGPDRKRGLQSLVRQTYPELFASDVDLGAATRAEIHDHFVREHNMHGQMARKAAGFFTLLATLAGMPLSAELRRESRQPPERRARIRARALLPGATAHEAVERHDRVIQDRFATLPRGAMLAWPVTLVLKPEMSEDEMVEVLRRFRRALERAEEDE